MPILGTGKDEMQNSRGNRPVVATVIGDPAGIGPEVVVKALATGRAHDVSRPFAIGSAAAVERAIEFTGAKSRVRTMSSLETLSDDPAVIDVLDSGALKGERLPLAEDSVLGGEATARWIDQMDQLARQGTIDAAILGPISSGSLKMVNKLDKVISPTPGQSYLLLVTGPLRVAHLTDHMPLREVCDLITPELVEGALVQLNEALKGWGIPNPRIVVSGLNPHAMGPEDREAIAPGVERARKRGVLADGPTSPDTVFRYCIEGRYDVVLAMFHDQGHIAVKTWGFSGNCVILLGPPYIYMSVAHGTAYDIVGTGVADSAMMLSAMETAGSLASGGGFPQES